MSGYYGSKTEKSIKDSWSTPQFIFDYYDSIYKFGVDLAADDKNHKCGLYFTEEMNSLDFESTLQVLRITGKDSSAIWCNPPYSDITPWVNLCVNLANELKVPVVVLIPADTSVKWFKLAWDNASNVDFINGRISFINASTSKPVNGNNKGSVCFTFNGRDQKTVSLIDRDSM